MDNSSIKYGMVIDLDKCIGCYACTVGCRKNKELHGHREGISLRVLELGKFPLLKRSFFPELCSNCSNPGCAAACPENALSVNDRGTVVWDEKKCIGCLSCVSSCPMGALNYNNGIFGKCDHCTDIISSGMTPMCVSACMGQAIAFGNLNDPESKIVKLLYDNQNCLYIRRELLGNTPNLFYILRGENCFDELIKTTYSLNFGAMNSSQSSKAKMTNSDAHSLKYVNTVDMMCPAECSIRVFTENGKVTKICGNPVSLNNYGTLCSKGAAGPELVYSEHRIRTPLERVGERGCGQWREISWELAAKKIAAKLVEIKKEHGAESVILDCGDLTDTEPYMMLFSSFGTPHLFTHSAICDTNRRWGSKLFMDDERPLPDIQRPILIRDRNDVLTLKYDHDIRLLINLGADPLVATRFSFMSRGITEARLKNSLYYVVADPAFTNSAAKADKWLPIKPGTDNELLACILHYIIMNDCSSDPERAYIDHDFIEKHTINWDKFKEDFLFYSRITDELNGFHFFTLEWGADKTGISKEEISDIAHRMGKTKPAAIEVGMHGTAHHRDGDIASVLSTVICAITGNIDVPGGLVFSGAVKPSRSFPSNRMNVGKIVKRRVNGETRNGNIKELHKDIYGDYPYAWKGSVSTIPFDILNGVELKRGTFQGYHYNIKGFINRTGNPLYTGGNTNEWKKAFLTKRKDAYQLDLIVHIDTHINETGKYADFILPECSYLEKMGLSDQYTINPEIVLRDRVISPLYESKSPFDIMKILADALSKAGDSDIDMSCFDLYASEEELINEQLSECPGLINAGSPLPYPKLPEGAVIRGVPDDPNAYINDELIHKGELLTVDWLRKHDGVAAWPVSYRRYISSESEGQSGKHKFNFGFFCDGTDRAFVWRENNRQFSLEMREKYPFFLITGRTHQTGTMTQFCKSLSGLETDANRKIETTPDACAVPIFLINTNDGADMNVATGDVIRLEAPNGCSILGKAYVSDTIRPGVVKTTFGQGGRKASSRSFMKMSAYTSNVNDLYDTDRLNKTTAMPAFSDIIVRIVKVSSIEAESEL